VRKSITGWLKKPQKATIVNAEYCTTNINKLKIVLLHPEILIFRRNSSVGCSPDEKKYPD